MVIKDRVRFMAWSKIKRTLPEMHLKILAKPRKKIKKTFRLYEKGVKASESLEQIRMLSLPEAAEK